MTIHEKALLHTLIYHDIFDYPLTKEELWHYTLSHTPLKKKHLLQAVKHCSFPLYTDKTHSLFSLRKTLFSLRKKRKKESTKKIALVTPIAHKLFVFPFIHLVAISGSVAHGNAKETDDIDLFIITQRNALWLSRLWVFLILSLSKRRRTKHTTNTTNTICVNFYLDTTTLRIPSQQQSSYTAHEVLSILPLFERHHMHARFLFANQWIKQFLPHAPIASVLPLQPSPFSFVLFPFEKLAHALQLILMAKPFAPDTIHAHRIAFFPQEREASIAKQFEKRLKRYKTQKKH